MKALKYILIAFFGIAAVFAAAVLFFAQLYLTPEVVKRSLCTGVEALLRRKVTCETITVSFIDGIIMQGVVLRKSLPWEQEDIVSCDEIKITCSLPPLLLKKLLVRTLEIKNPVVHLQFDEKKPFRLYGNERSAAHAGPSLQLLFIPRSVMVHNGAVMIIGPRQHFSVGLDRVQLAARDISLLTPFDFTASAFLAGGTEPAINCTGTYSLARDKLDSRVTLQNISSDSLKSLFEACNIPVERGTFSITSNISGSPAAGMQAEVQCTARDAALVLQPAPAPENWILLEGFDATLSFEAEWDGLRKICSIREIKGSTLASPYSGSGIIRSRGRPSTIGLNLRSEQFSLDELCARLRLQASSLLRGLKLAGTVGVEVSMDGKLDASFGPAVLITLRGNKIIYPALRSFQPELSGSLRIDKKSIALADLQIGTSNLSVTLAGDITGYLEGSPRSSVKIVSSRINFYELFNPWNTQQAEDIGPFDCKGLAFSGPIRLGTTSFLGMVLNNVEGSYFFENNKFFIRDFAGKIGDSGGFSLAASVDLGLQGLDYGAQLTITDVAVKTLRSLLGFDLSQFMEGNISGSCSLSGRGTTPEGFMENLTGDAILTLGNGHVKGFSMPPQLMSFLKSDELGKIDFTEAQFQLQLRNGLVHLAGGSLISQKIEVHPSGDVGLEGSLDLTATLKLAPELFAADSKLVSYLPHESGWIALPILIRGTLQKPRVTLSDEAMTYILQETLPQLLMDLMSEQGAGEAVDNETEEEGR